MTSASSYGSEPDSCLPGEFSRPPRRQVAISMTCVMLAMFLAALGQTTVATALPDIVADLGGFDRYVWVATAYMVAATVAAPIAGGLSDLYGRKPFFIVGLIVFIAASALLGVSHSMDAVIAFRALQGIGGGLVMTASLVSVADLFPPEERGKHQGSLVGVYGVASIVGPIVGGFITHHSHWHWVFLLNIPIAVPVLLLMIWVFPRGNPGIEHRRLDYSGTITLALAIVPVFLALSLGGVQYAWSSPQCLGLIALGLAMAVTFLVIESRAESPIMSLELYKDRSVASAMMVVWLTGFVLYGSVIFLPLFFQGVLEVSASTSSQLLAPMLPGIVFGAIVSGQLLSRAGGRYRLGPRRHGTHRSRDVFGLDHERDDKHRPHRGLHHPHGDWPRGHAGCSLGGGAELGAVQVGRSGHVGQPVLADHGRHDGSGRNGSRNGAELPVRC